MRLLLFFALACRRDGVTPPDDTGLPGGIPTDTEVEAPPGEMDFGCDPAAEPQSGLEGDTLSLDFACQGDVQAESWTLLAAPEGVQLDTTTGVATWATDLASAGEWRVSVAAHGEGTEYATGRFRVTDALGEPGNVGIDPANYTTEFGLPVFHLAVPEGTNANKMWPTTATYRGTAYPVEIQRRGATSSHYPKTSFRVDFPPDQEFEDEDEGFPKRRSICLTTTFDDNAYFRQLVVYDLWNAMDPTRQQVESMFVVLYLDAVYVGLYMLTDRINGEWWEDYGHFEDGNLYKSVDHSANFFPTFAGEEKTSLHSGWEKKSGVDEEDFSDLDALMTFVYDVDDDTFDRAIGGQVVVDEWFDWWALAYYTAAFDTVGKNAYLYNDPDAPGWRHAPWDFNHSLGQRYTTERELASNDWYVTGENGMFTRLRASAAYGSAMQQRFRDHRQGVLTPDYIDALIDGYTARIDASARRDWGVWGEQYRSYEKWSERTDFTDYDGEVAYVRQWVRDRHDYVESWDP